jgi:hypothetical protein
VDLKKGSCFAVKIRGKARILKIVGVDEKKYYLNVLMPLGVICGVEVLKNQLIKNNSFLFLRIAQMEKSSIEIVISHLEKVLNEVLIPPEKSVKEKKLVPIKPAEFRKIVKSLALQSEILAMNAKTF